MSKSLDLSLYFIVGPSHMDGDGHDLVSAAVRGGVTCLQYRDKTSTTRQMIERARALKSLLEGTGVPLFINDRVDVALASGADGVHVGRDDMAVDQARSILGPDKLLGVTLKNEGEVAALDPTLVDYGSFGGVFETTSKKNPDPPIGVDGLTALAKQLKGKAPNLPQCAIAGINQSNVVSVIACGLDGACVITAITKAADAESAARDLRQLIENEKGRQA